MEMVPSRAGGVAAIAVLLCDGEALCLRSGNEAARMLFGSLPLGSPVNELGWKAAEGWPDAASCATGATTRMCIGQDAYQVTRETMSDGVVCLLVEPLLLDADAELSQAVEWLEAVDEPVLLLDDGGTVIFATGRAERDHAYDTGGMVGCHLGELHRPRPGGPTLPEGRGELGQALRRLVVQGAPRRYQAWHLRRDGGRFPTTVLLRPRQVGGRTLILALVRDEASHQGRIDDLERALGSCDTAGRIKSKVLSTAGHDLRTPLTAILGFC
jgi:hypothetical protein